MTVSGWLQILFVFALVLATVVPLGRHMARVFAGERTILSPVVGPIERGLLALAGRRSLVPQTWLGYTLAMLVFNAAGFALLYAILRLQGLLPLDPQGFDGVDPLLAFNTAMSFVTNTNWQAYGGETTMSHFAQMAGLTVQNFLSAATGMALAAVMIRGFAVSGSDRVGNFWVDLTRVTLHVLLPLSVVLALVFVALGIPQTLVASVDATTLEGAEQTIALGPVAGQEAIKLLGTNGGGFFNANAAHPFENPSAITDALEIWALLAISFALTHTFGRMVGDARQGWAILAVMVIVLGGCLVVAYWAEAGGNPLMTSLGVDPSLGNMEGKEVRFGPSASALYAVATTATSTGSVNSMHESFMPLGGFMPLLLMKLGEIVPGGVGSGLYGILVIAVVTVFIAGLMVGRTPEYLGKKIEAREMKLAMLAQLILPATILGFTAVAAMLPTALASLANAGPHGLTELLYAYASATGNNGSAFAGLSANTPWYDLTLGIAMFLGRFGYIVPVMAIAGSLAPKTRGTASAGTFPTHGALFVGLVTAVILILGGLQFFPAFALGPIVEHLMIPTGVTF
jgi:K+-transporting ATPase ATPase A chain